VKVDFDKDGKVFVAKDQPDFVLVPPAPAILTPPAPATPRINGPKIFGVRPGSPFLYSIPATGDRPMKFSADKLPRGLKLDSKTGRITGALKKSGEYEVALRAKKYPRHGGETVSHCRWQRYNADAADGLEHLLRISPEHQRPVNSRGGRRNGPLRSGAAWLVLHQS